MLNELSKFMFPNLVLHAQKVDPSLVIYVSIFKSFRLGEVTYLNILFLNENRISPDIGQVLRQRRQRINTLAIKLMI